MFPLDLSHITYTPQPTHSHRLTPIRRSLKQPLAMCQVPSYTSPIAVSQPSTYSCCPITPMSNRSSFDRYLNMDSSSIDFIQAAPVVLRGQNLPYYATIGLLLVSIWLYQSIQASKINKVKVPFYKASILKWYFDAESLVRDSYYKVCTPCLSHVSGISLIYRPVLRSGLSDQGNGRNPGLDTSQVLGRVERPSRRHSQRNGSRQRGQNHRSSYQTVVA